LDALFSDQMRSGALLRREAGVGSTRQLGNGQRTTSMYGRGHAKPSNQAMQLTASKPAIYAGGVCRRERMLRGMHRGLATADLVSR
jgi:hypothetical protein